MSRIHSSHILSLSSILMVLPAFTHCDRTLHSSQFPAPGASTTLELNHLTVDSASGQVYVGAVNWLYQLNDELGLVNSVQTGPMYDSPFCLEPFTNEQTCLYNGRTTVQKELTPNHNKILALDARTDYLITCGSIKQGTCQLRSISNITASQAYENGAKFYIAANDADLSTVGFVGPGPSAGHSVLYVGSTYTGKTSGDFASTSFRGLVPAVSSRSLNTVSKTLEVAFKNAFISKGTEMKFKSDNVRVNYLINYVTGFNVDGYSYFLTTQEATYLPEANVHESKIIQICQSDENYDSYIEIPINCVSSTETYNLVQSVTVTQPGPLWAQRLAMSQSDHVMVATFAKADGTSGQPLHHSAVCVYKMSDVREAMAENLQRCFDGRSSSRGEQFTGATECRAQVSTTSVLLLV